MDRLPGKAGQAHREARKQEEVDAQKKIQRQQSQGFTMVKEFQRRQQSKSGGLSLQQEQQGGGADMS